MLIPAVLPFYVVLSQYQLLRDRAPWVHLLKHPLCLSLRYSLTLNVTTINALHNTVHTFFFLLKENLNEFVEKYLFTNMFK